MEKKLLKSLNRIKGNYPEMDYNSKSFKKLTPAQVTAFNSIKKEYDLSILNDSPGRKEIESELTEEAKLTLKRINEGEDFKI